MNKNENLDRKQFLQKFGVGGVFALTAVCLSSCVKKDFMGPPSHILEDNYEPPGLKELDVVIDITQPEYKNLKWPGGWVIIQGSVVVAKTENSEEYVAASRICSDEVLSGIIFSGDEWYCTEHDATFDLTGKGTETYNNKGFRGLRVYQTELTGNMLRIYA